MAPKKSEPKKVEYAPPMGTDDIPPSYTEDELRYIREMGRAMKQGAISQEEYADAVARAETMARQRMRGTQRIADLRSQAAKMPTGMDAFGGEAGNLARVQREMGTYVDPVEALLNPTVADTMSAPMGPMMEAQPTRMQLAQAAADRAAIGTRGLASWPMEPDYSDRRVAARDRLLAAQMGSRGGNPIAIGPDNSMRRMAAQAALDDARLGTRGLAPIPMGATSGPLVGRDTLGNPAFITDPRTAPANPFLTLSQAADDARVESLARMGGGTVTPTNPAAAMSRAANVGGQLASQGMGSTPAARTWMQIQDARAEAVQRAASEMRAPGVGYKTVLNKADDLTDADRAVRSVLNTRPNDDWIMGGPLGNSRRVTPLTADDIIAGRVGTATNGTPGSVAQLANAADEIAPAKAYTPGLTRALTALGSRSPQAARAGSWLAAHPKIAGGGTAAAGVAAGMVARPLVDALNIGGEDSYWDTILTGGAGMAATGAGVGSFFGPMGALAGGALGGGIGMLASGLSYKGSAGSQFSKEANKLAQQLTTTADALGLSGEARAELNEQFLTAQALANADPKNPNVELLRQSYATLLAQLPAAKQRQTRTSSTAMNALATQAAISQYARPYVDDSIQSAKFRADALNSLANSVGGVTGMGDSLRARAIDAEGYGRDIANSWARSLAVAPTIQAMNENLDYYNQTGTPPNSPYFTLTTAG